MKGCIRPQGCMEQLEGIWPRGKMPERISLAPHGVPSLYPSQWSLLRRAVALAELAPEQRPPEGICRMHTKFWACAACGKAYWKVIAQLQPTHLGPQLCMNVGVFCVRLQSIMHAKWNLAVST